MDRLFDHSLILDCDSYIADYSEATKDEKKVVISLEPLTDIAYFHLHKRNKNNRIPYLAVNLEEYPAFRKDIENCECVFKSINPSDSL